MPTIQQLRDEVAQILSKQQDLVSGLSERQLRWQPEPTRWSVLDCLGHISSVAQPYADRLREPLVSAPEDRQDKGDLPLSFMARILTRMMEPPVRMRSSTPKAYEPQVSSGTERVLDEFERMQNEFLSILDLLEKRQIPSKKVTSPVAGMLKLRLPAWFSFLAAHARRHLWQAEQVIAHADFPHE